MTAEAPVPSRGLVDTNIIILREWLEPDVLPDQFAISAVTLAELTVGPHAVIGDDRRARTERARRTAILQRTEVEFEPRSTGTRRKPVRPAPGQCPNRVCGTSA